MTAKNLLRNPLVFIGSILVIAAIASTLIFLNHSTTNTRPLPTASTLARSDAWDAFGGDWTVLPTEIQNNSQERGSKLMVRNASPNASPDGAWSDYQVDADLQIAEPYGEAGIVIRSNGEEEGVDAYRGYFAGIRTMDASFEFGRADFGWHSFIHRALPSNPNLTAPIHLRLVAVGCRFAVLITLADGRQTGSSTEDPGCLRTGRFGLRSDFTSVQWTNLRITPASASDIAQVEARSQASPTPAIAATEPFDQPTLGRYAASLQAEAIKHEIQPGVQPIVSFLMSPGSHPNVTIQGVITSVPPLTDIQDDTNALLVNDVDPSTHLKLGDVVEAEGTVVSERFRSRLDHPKIKVLWSDNEIPPLAVTAAQLTSGTYRGRSIEIEGVLQSSNIRKDGFELILRDGDQSFKAIGSNDPRMDLAGLAVGSRLRLKGMATSLTEFTGGIYPFAIVTNRVQVIGSPPWWSPQHVALLIFISVAVLLFSQYLMHRIQIWHMRSVLREREQLAFEMHDTLAQSFTGIAYQLQAASIEHRGETMTRNHIRQALAMVHTSHREASRTIAALRPQYRDAAGIVQALKESAERLSDGGGLIIHTTMIGKVIPLRLEVTDALVRIGQEAISNAIQHSACKTLTISLTLSRHEAQLLIQDDGAGFDEHLTQHGLGIASMRQRANKIKARLDLQTIPGQGTTITVSAPRSQAGDWFSRLRNRLATAMHLRVETLPHSPSTNLRPPSP